MSEMRCRVGAQTPMFQMNLLYPSVTEKQFTLTMEAANSSETFISVYPNTQRRNSDYVVYPYRV